LHTGENSLKIQLKLKTRGEVAHSALCHINFTAISRRCKSSKLHLLLLGFWALGPGVLRSGFCRILLLAPAAEILLPLFMLSLCNILPASFSCSSSLSSLVFNILQLAKELLLKPATKRKPKSHGLLLWIFPHFYSLPLLLVHLFPSFASLLKHHHLSGSLH